MRVGINLSVGSVSKQSGVHIMGLGVGWGLGETRPNFSNIAESRSTFHQKL